MNPCRFCSHIFVPFSDFSFGPYWDLRCCVGPRPPLPGNWPRDFIFTCSSENCGAKFQKSFRPRRQVRRSGRERWAAHRRAWRRVGTGRSSYSFGPINSFPASNCWKSGRFRSGSQTGSIFRRAREIHCPAGIDNKRRRVFTASSGAPACA